MDAKELFGSKIGDRVILKTPEGDFEYTISGFMRMIRSSMI